MDPRVREDDVVLLWPRAFCYTLMYRERCRWLFPRQKKYSLSQHQAIIIHKPNNIHFGKQRRYLDYEWRVSEIEIGVICFGCS
jgi:hypothetical protein